MVKDGGNWLDYLFAHRRGPPGVSKAMLFLGRARDQSGTGKLIGR